MHLVTVRFGWYIKDFFEEASKMVANLLLVLIEYQFEQEKMSMCLNRVQFIFRTCTS